MCSRFRRSRRLPHLLVFVLSWLVGQVLLLVLVPLLVLQEERVVGQLQEAHPVSLTWAFCGVSTTAGESLLDQCCSVIRRTLRVDTTPSSVLTRCSSVTSLCPSHTLGKRDNTAATRPSHCAVEKGLRIVTQESRNEANRMTDNPFHQCAVNRRSALREVLQCCQHRALLSLQLFLTVFDCFVALM